MATDKNQLGDEYDIDAPDGLAELEPGMTLHVTNEGTVLVEDGSLPPIGNAPKANAGLDAWVDYAVSLGADRHFLTTETQHVADATPGIEVIDTDTEWTVAEIKDLCERLGG